MLKIKQVELLEEILNEKVETSRIIENNINTTDPDWSGADNYNIPTQLTVKEYVNSKIGTAGSIGTPDDGTYNDGFYKDWTSVSTVANVVDAINTLLADLAPESAETLAGETLVGPTLFTAKLSNNNPNQSDWIVDGVAAGDTITNITDSSTIALTQQNPSTTFYVGIKRDYPADLTEVISAWKSNTITYSTPTSTRDVSSTTGGIGTTGILEITDISIYNSVYVKANARIINSPLDEGYNQFKISTVSSGETDTYKVYYTGTYSDASFSVSPVLVENSISYKYLSGVPYYSTGSSFNVTFTADNLYSPVYVVGNQSSMDSDFFNNVNFNYAGIPNYNSQLVISNYTITLSANKSSDQTLGTGDIELYKPNKTDVTSPLTIGNKGINTMGTVSTSTVEQFYDEARRYTSKDIMSWNPNTVFTDTQGQLETFNGILIDPRYSGHYTSYIETVNYYRRGFGGRSTTIDKGQLIINKSGTLGEPTTWLNLGGDKFQVTMWVQRSTVWTQYDLGVGVGLTPGDGGIGIKDEDNSSAGVIKWALGSEYITPSDIVIIDIKFNNALATDYISQLEMVWNW